MSPRVLPALVLAFAVIATSGCTSPTLPLPPPSLSKLEVDNAQVVAEGHAIPGSIVFVFNRDLGEGTMTTADEEDGFFRAVVPGEVGDLIVVWSQLDDEESPTIERLVPPF